MFYDAKIDHPLFVFIAKRMFFFTFCTYRRNSGKKLLIHSLILYNQFSWCTIKMPFAVMRKMSLRIKIELFH